MKKDFKILIYRWIFQVIDPIKILTSIPRFVSYFSDWYKYSRIPKAEPIRIIDTYPCIFDKTETTNFDPHYFYQDIWAFSKIFASKVNYHIDIGSRIDFIGYLTSITKVTFIDIRPLVTNLENLNSIKASILSLPFEDNSIASASCLHVAEHIGLGRYGDPLDPEGTYKACKELQRVLTKDGDLYFSLPVGKPKLSFNAHRIHSPQQILDYFNDLRLIEFSIVDDQGQFKKNVNISLFRDSSYSDGLFWFKK